MLSSELLGYFRPAEVKAPVISSESTAGVSYAPNAALPSSVPGYLSDVPEIRCIVFALCLWAVPRGSTFAPPSPTAI